MPLQPIISTLMEDDVIITMVAPANILKVWPQISPLIAPALAISDTHETEDIRKQVLSGNAQAWVQWSDKVDCSVVTEFKNYPNGLWLNVWLSGALEGAKVLWDKFSDEVIEFAKANGCIGIEYTGRDGWIRKMGIADLKKETILARYRF